MKLRYLWRGLPGHPLHPPLTDATIGVYTAAAVLAGLDYSGGADVGNAWWIVLILGLCFAAVTALTGLIDWLTITWWTPLWWTATTHALVNIAATVIFGIAAIAGYSPREAGGLEFVLMLAGYAVLALGGWIGGTITFVHGMRVLNLPDLPSLRAISPKGTPEKEEADA